MNQPKNQAAQNAGVSIQNCEARAEEKRKERVDLSPSGTEGCVWEESFPWLDEVESGWE